MAQRKESAGTKERKEKILRTTLQLLIKKGGYTATSTTDICNAARIARPSLYHYFGSKRNLLFSIHMDHIEKVLKPYLDIASSIEDPLERLKYMVNWYTREIICRYPELRLLIHDTLTIRDKYFLQVRREWKRHLLLLKGTIAELKEKGLIGGEVRPSWAALFMLGMMTWVTFWLDYSRQGDADAMAEAMVQFVVNGLGGKERSRGQRKRKKVPM